MYVFKEMVWGEVQRKAWSTCFMFQPHPAPCEELDAAGNVLGGGGNAKHSFNSFATQEFTFSSPESTVIEGVKNTTNGMQPFDYDVTKISFTSYLGGGNSETDSKLVVEAIIFKTDAILQFTIPSDVEGGDPSYFYSYSTAGSVKFNVKMSQWNWCNNDCKSGNGVGESVRLTIEMTNKIIADDSSEGGCGNECKTGDVQDLGGVFLSVLNTYSIVNGETSTEYTMPVAPSLTLDPPPGSNKGSSRTTTLVLEFPKANFGPDDTLVYDPMLSYDSFSADSDTTTVTMTTTAEGGSSGSTEFTTEAGSTASTTAGSTTMADGTTDAGTTGAGGTTDAGGTTGAATTTVGNEPPPSSANRALLSLLALAAAALFA